MGNEIAIYKKRKKFSLFLFCLLFPFPYFPISPCEGVCFPFPHFPSEGETLGQTQVPTCLNPRVGNDRKQMASVVRMPFQAGVEDFSVRLQRPNRIPELGAKVKRKVDMHNRDMV